MRLTPAQVVAEAASVTPDALALIDGGEPVDWATFHDRCMRLAAGMVKRGIERFASVVDDPRRGIELLVASSAVGVDACVYPAGVGAEELRLLRDRFDHDVAVCMDPSARDGDGWVAFDSLFADEPVTPREDGRAPLLVLTTGTTGLPKGACHDWRRLASGGSRWKSPDGARWLLAYNLNQFGGIQVVLHSLNSQSTLVIPADGQPRSALTAILEDGVTHASGTPTFWRFLLSLVDDFSTLPPLRQVTLGGEPVPPDLIDKVTEAFPDARISQVYGSTESGTSASAMDAAAGLPVSVLDRPADAPVQLKIVDGELYFRSTTGMLGYYGEEFDPDGKWVPTGDLVEIRGDRIHFTGRSVEIINVGGVKVSPLSVEERALAVDEVRFAHAYGRPNPVAGQIVTLDVVVDGELDDEREELIEDKIRASCESLPPAAQPRRIRFVPELEVRDHKVRRGGDS